MSASTQIEAKVSFVGKLLGYRLEAQPISPRQSRQQPHPPDASWETVGIRFQPKTSMRVRAAGGIFGATAYVEIYQRGKKVRTPDYIRAARTVMPAFVRTFGILTVRRA